MLSSMSDKSLSVYCDVDWSACTFTRRSLSAYVTLIGDSPVSWKTKKQGVVSHSSAEAEYRSRAQTTREVKWLRGFDDCLVTWEQNSTSLRKCFVIVSQLSIEFPIISFMNELNILSQTVIKSEMQFKMAR